MLIDCDTCRMRDIACGDCVISLLLGAPEDSHDLDDAEAAALGALAAGGLAPPLRWCRSAAPIDPTWRGRRRRQAVPRRLQTSPDRRALAAKIPGSESVVADRVGAITLPVFVKII